MALAFLAGMPLFGLGIPSEWAFGERPDNALIETSFTVTNTAHAPGSISILVTCDCLSVKPAFFDLGGGSSVRVHVTFDPKSRAGPFSGGILVRVRGGETADAMVKVHGTITTGAPAASGEGCRICRDLEDQFRDAASASSPRPRLSLRYYFSADCQTCTALLQSEIPRLEKMLGMEITVDLRDIAENAYVEEIEQALAGKGIPLTAFPVVAVNGVVLQSEKEIRERLAAVLLETTSARRQ